MTDIPDLWEARELTGRLALGMHAGDDPALVLAQGEDRVKVDLADVKGVMAALVDAAADLAELLATGARCIMRKVPGGEPHRGPRKHKTMEKSAPYAGARWPGWRPRCGGGGSSSSAIPAISRPLRKDT